MATGGRAGGGPPPEKGLSTGPCMGPCVGHSVCTMEGFRGNVEGLGGGGRGEVVGEGEMCVWEGGGCVCCGSHLPRSSHLPGELPLGQCPRLTRMEV